MIPAEKRHRNTSPFIILSIVFVAIFSLNAYSAEGQEQIALTISTDRLDYLTGQAVTIRGEVLDQDGNPLKAKVSLNISFGEKVVYTSSTFANGKYSNSGFKVPESGEYTVTASVVNNGVKEEASTSFRGLEMWETLAFYSLIAGAVSIGGLLLSSTLLNKHPVASQVLRFVFLTSIAFSPIVSMVFADTEIGLLSPVGLVIITGEQGVLDSWVINIGGTLEKGFKDSGIQIPIYVIVFGILGAYIRYLYSFFEKRKEIFTYAEWSSMDRLSDSLSYLASLFLAPLLAIALWFVLRQAGVLEDFILLAVSILVGLLIEEIVERLLAFVRSVLERISTVAQPQSMTT